MWNRSLRFQLLAGILVPLGIVMLAQMYAFGSARETAQSVTDRLLLSSARSIAEQVRYGDNGVEAVVPPAALGIFDLGFDDRVYYRVTTSEGRLLAGYPDLPEPAGRVSDPLFYDGRFRNSDVRLVAVSQPIAAPAKHLTGTIVVAESLHGRDAMQLHLWRGTAFAQLVLVVFASALAWYGQRRDLAPLVRLGGEIRKRRPDEFRPFATTTLQSELHPFVAALNDSMQRLQQQLDAQRRFTANAAHQYARRSRFCAHRRRTRCAARPKRNATKPIARS